MVENNTWSFTLSEVDTNKDGKSVIHLIKKYAPPPEFSNIEFESAAYDATIPKDLNLNIGSEAILTRVANESEITGNAIPVHGFVTLINIRQTQPNFMAFSAILVPKIQECKAMEKDALVFQDVCFDGCKEDLDIFKIGQEMWFALTFKENKLYE